MPRTLTLRNHPTTLHDHLPCVTIEADAEAFHDQLVSKLGAMTAPGAGGAQPLELSPLIVGLFVRDLQTIVVSVGGIDQAVAMAQDAYAKYVAPIDLPQVPNFIEPAVDRAMSYVLGIILRNAWTEMQKNPLPPLPSNPTKPVGSVGAEGPTAAAESAGVILDGHKRAE